MIDDTLVQRTLEVISRVRALPEEKRPAPLRASPKCPRCSLVGICLPDESTLLLESETAPTSTPRLLAPLEGGQPVYVQEPFATLSKRDELLQVKRMEDGTSKVVAELRLNDVSHLCLFGNIQASTQLLHELMDRSIPVAFFSYGGWFKGIMTGIPGKNIGLRIAQYELARDKGRCLSLAKQFIGGKIANQRTFLRRNLSGDKKVVDTLRYYQTPSSQSKELPELLGWEGIAARGYFSSLSECLKTSEQGISFSLEGRNRRPPLDPVNALLSYGYSILTKEATIACLLIGLDPYLGFLHQPRFGRPALALDLMEEFRPLIVDSVVIRSINTGEISLSDFSNKGDAVILTPDGKKKFLGALERRLSEQVTHPIFKYKTTYRRALALQARVLAAVLLEETNQYQGMVTR